MWWSLMSLAIPFIPQYVFSFSFCTFLKFWVWSSVYEAPGEGRKERLLILEEDAFYLLLSFLCSFPSPRICFLLFHKKQNHMGLKGICLLLFRFLLFRHFHSYLILYFDASIVVMLLLHRREGSKKWDWDTRTKARERSRSDIRVRSRRNIKSIRSEQNSRQSTR